MELASGPDGKLWFAGRTVATPGNTRLVKMGLDGSLLATYDLNAAQALPTRLAAGPDGHLWVNTWGNTITRFDPANGSQAAFSMPSTLGNSGASGIATGADGNLWMVMPRGLGRTSPLGQVTAFPVDTSGSYFGLSSSIVNGPDGRLWFGNLFDPWNLYRLNPADGSYQTVDISSISFGADTLAAGPDGQVWFLPSGKSAIDKIDPTTLQITSYPLRNNAPRGLAAGPDGNLWYVTSSFYLQNVIGRITPQGRVTEYPLPADTKASNLTIGPDNHFWYVESHQDAATGDDVYNIATFAIPANVPQCSASPTTAFWDTSVTFSCTALTDTGQLALSGGSCGPIQNGVSQCTALLGNTDGTVIFTDAQGQQAQMPNRLTQISPAYCSATPDLAFAGTSITLSCSGLPAGASLTVTGAVCQAAQPDGSVNCSGTLGSGPNALSDWPQAQTRLSNGTLGTSTVGLSTLVVHCSASPNPARAGEAIVITCPDAPNGSTVTIPGAQCAVALWQGATCIGVASDGHSGILANPLAAVAFLGVTQSGTVLLSISQNPSAPGPTDAVTPIPALDGMHMACTVLLLGCLGAGRLHRRA